MPAGGGALAGIRQRCVRSEIPEMDAALIHRALWIGTGFSQFDGNGRQFERFDADTAGNGTMVNSVLAVASTSMRPLWREWVGL